MFSSLKIRDYRYLWLGSLCSSFGMNMQMVARGWLIYALTGSSEKLAWVMVSFMLPQVLFSLVGGALADRLPKKFMVIASQGLNFVASLILALIIISGNVTFWHFIYFGIFNGTVLAFNMPARDSLIPEIVGERFLLNAMALRTTSMNLARIVGPASAGAVIALFAEGDKTSTFGVGVVYCAIAGLYLVAAISTFMVRMSGQPSAVERHSIGREIAAGVRFVWASPVLSGLVLMSIVPFLFGMPAQSLMPAFNEDVLGGGPEDLGFIMGAMGAGAIIGSLTLARMSDVRRRGLIMFGSCALWGAGIMAFCQSSTLPVAMVLVAFMGMFSTSYMAMNRTLIQLSTNQEMRGRIMSIDMMVHGMMPLGILPFGFLADYMGIRFALTLSGFLLALLSLVLLATLKSVRQIDRGYVDLTTDDVTAQAPAAAAGGD
jgi:MFS family permease